MIIKSFPTCSVVESTCRPGPKRHQGKRKRVDHITYTVQNQWMHCISTIYFQVCKSIIIIEKCVYGTFFVVEIHFGNLAPLAQQI